ncbi:Hsp20/alpha crystallin family protein [Paenibacillus gansuensis]|uniref:Hsp20/alpha crystallin family protein n=1 Tax=Paenibacillus gansuensis TaxID=306542 RepID=A0ABW5PGQ7_9BACL
MDKDNKDPFNWNQFHELFRGHFPSGNGQPPVDTGWIQNYVQDTLQRAFTSSTAGKPSAKLTFPSEVFETHNNVVVKISVPDLPTAKNIQPHVSATRVKLENGADGNSQYIPLHSHVVPQSCKAVYKNGILQLHLKKAKISDTYYEARVRFLE